MKKSLLLSLCLLLVLSPAMLADENDATTADIDGTLVTDDSTLGDGDVLEELGIEKRGLQPRLGNSTDGDGVDGHEHGQGHGEGHEHGNGHGPGHSHGQDEDGDDENNDEDGDETPISN